MTYIRCDRCGQLFDAKNSVHMQTSSLNGSFANAFTDMIFCRNCWVDIRRFISPQRDVSYGKIQFVNKE